MARLSLSTKKKVHAALNVLIVYLRTIFVACATSCFYSWYRFQKRLRSPSPCQTVIRVYKQLEYLHGLIYESDVTCIAELRMDRRSFHRLCQVLVTRGHLRATRNVSIEEMVAFFLYILAHHLKNRTINHHFRRSGRTISKYFHECIKAMIRCQKDFWQTPEPIPENSTDTKWKWFKNCLGALDGTPVKVHVPECDKPKYRTRKNEIATNVLGVCTPDMQFIYVLPGWEGSAHDGRVLRDAVTRRNGLKVPNGCYYLVDGGYTNGKGFLAPYRRTRYHLNEWRDGYRPTTPAEFFNMKHSSARNVIERCFGLLKMRWGILRSPSYYDIKTHRRIISVCCMLHNFIRREMVVDPIEADADGQFQDGNSDANNYITTVESSDEWTAWRDNLAQEMWNNRAVH
ncbi:protein ALP1-like isoform X1 [Malus domestica]|uniref:protein ALP1-like isoform X1 n=1 Tax=Malus domestica TaxID=3750 RepID=UPI003974CE7B